MFWDENELKGAAKSILAFFRQSEKVQRHPSPPGVDCVEVGAFSSSFSQVHPMEPKQVSCSTLFENPVAWLDLFASWDHHSDATG